MKKNSARSKRRNSSKLGESRKRRGAGSHRKRRVGWRRLENSKRILAAAEAVFSERGYEGATTALIAKKAGLAKANVHYYFPTKLHIYKAAIESILKLWLSAFDSIQPDDDPTEAFTKYIRAKIDYSRTRPFASRVFANEIIGGAPVIRRFLSSDLRKWVQRNCNIFRRWADAGKITPLAHPEHLFFIIWAATQTYADFSAQMCAVLGKKKLTDDDYEYGANLLTHLILVGCGVTSKLHGLDQKMQTYVPKI
jgi:TetR/AcrR family transcriptional regulator